MEKNILELFDKNRVDVNLMPIDLFFIKERAKSQNKNTSINNKTSINSNLAKPNYIDKINYSGFVHFLPANPISQILNPENFF